MNSIKLHIIFEGKKYILHNNNLFTTLEKKFIKNFKQLFFSSSQTLIK